MTEKKWSVTFKVLRQKENEKPHFENYTIEVSPDEYVLDGIERIWAFNDRTLTYRHACHHSTCGACGMRINGVEKLTCITPIRDIAKDGGVIQVEPLRNFPVVSDLVVDIGTLFEKIEKAHALQVAKDKHASLPYELSGSKTDEDYERLVDCIECGLCVSACPSALTSPTYLGPAVLAAAQLAYQQNQEKYLIDLVDCTDGLWRCHSAYECSAVCPSNVDPAWRIMNMRRTVISQKVISIIKLKREAHE